MSRPRKGPGFQEPSTELRNAVYERVVSRDRPVVTSKLIRGLPYTSRFSLIFTSFKHQVDVRKEYASYLEARMGEEIHALKVNVVDFNFVNFIRYLKYMRDRHGDRALARFHLPSRRDPLFLDLSGDCFAAGIIFTKRFEHDQAKLHRWIKKSNELGKKYGHLRVFYAVTRGEDTRALADMINHLHMQEGEEGTGQLRYITKALQSFFARPVSGSMAGGYDINRSHRVLGATQEEAEEDEALRRIHSRITQDKLTAGPGDVGAGAEQPAGQDGAGTESGGQATWQQVTFDPGTHAQMVQAPNRCKGPQSLPPTLTPLGGLPVNPHTVPPLMPSPVPFGATTQVIVPYGHGYVATASPHTGGDVEMTDVTENSQVRIKAEPDDDEQRVDLSSVSRTQFTTQQWSAPAHPPALVPQAAVTTHSVAAQGGQYDFVPLLPSQGYWT